MFVTTGKLSDSNTLRESKITKGVKVMLIGSTVADLLAVTAPDMAALKEEMAKEEAASKEPLCKQKVREKFGQLRESEKSFDVQK